MFTSAVFSVDPIYGPCEATEIERENSAGDKVAYQMPKLISVYNKYMHEVDVFDQVRKQFGVDLVHPTKTYTVRVFEILFSMVLGQAYNIHRSLHAGTNRSLTHTDFKWQIIRGFLNHHASALLLQLPRRVTISWSALSPGPFMKTARGVSGSVVVSAPT